VIVDSFDHFYRACVQCFNRFGFPQFADRERVIAFNNANWFEALAAAGVPEQVSDAIEETYAALVDVEGDTPQPFDGMCELLNELGSHNTLVIITAARGHIVERFLARHGVDTIDRVLGSDTETSKVRRIASARAEFGAALEAWYVGDTVGDIVEGKQAGATTVAVTWGWQPAEALSEASPDRIVRSPRELLELLSR
jgi:phosphoglycolate phosphatase